MELHHYMFSDFSVGGWRRFSEAKVITNQITPFPPQPSGSGITSLINLRPTLPTMGEYSNKFIFLLFQRAKTSFFGRHPDLVHGANVIKNIFV